MIGGFVLDPSAIAAVARGTRRAMLSINRCDVRANALLIPMTAMTEALTLITRTDELKYALDLMDFGVAVDHGLTKTYTEPVATTFLAAEDRTATTLGMAHAAVAARERQWPVLTDLPKRWRAAYPGVELAALC